MLTASEYSLGPLPWSDEVLVAAAWSNSGRAQDLVDEHPGCDLDLRLNSLQAVLGILSRASNAFAAELERFHGEVRGGHLFRRNRKSDLNAFEERFRELLYVFASSAMTLVDQSRALSKKVDVPGYNDRIRETFSLNPQHRFIQELRVDLIHVTLHRPGWKLTFGAEEERTSKFMLWPKQLNRANEYNAQARQYLRDHSDGIDLGRLIADYTRQIQEFHSWLSGAVMLIEGPIIADYQRCTRQIKAVSSRSLWNIIFKQVLISGKRDPYSYLDQYLTQSELVEIMSLPLHSRQQVDRIIELVDEYGVCDEDLRKTVYEAFGTSDA
ncbi:MAG: hypothetical protein LT106_13015 [Burkholderiaceae bacterium]|nr:hypothetical protein [Burkholderiaceae bacterium]